MYNAATEEAHVYQTNTGWALYGGLDKERLVRGLGKGGLGKEGLGQGVGQGGLGKKGSAQGVGQ